MVPSRIAPRCTLFLCALVLFAILILPAQAQHKSPTEAQCQQMTEGMLGVMKSTIGQLTKDKEREDAKALLERVETMVKEGRAKGERECEIYSKLNKMIVNQ